MANKKTNPAIIVLVIVGVLFLINQGVFQTASVVGTPSICSGQVLNIDPNIEVAFSNNLQKNVIRATYSTLPASECLDIVLSEAQIESQIDGFDADADILLDIQLLNQRKVFNVQEDSSQFFRRFVTQNIGNVVLCTENACEDAGFDNAFFSGRAGATLSDCWCVADSNNGVAGDFLLTEGIEWDTRVKLGSFNTLTLTETQTTGNIGGNIAFVQWAGNLQSNIEFGGLVGQKDTFKPLTDNIWRMTSQGTFNLMDTQYTSVRNDLVLCETSGTLPGLNCNNQIGAADGYNSDLILATNDQLLQWTQQEPALLNFGSFFESNQLIATLQSPIVYPQFVIEIDAEEVGIFVSVGGTPEVTCPQVSGCIQSGETISKTVSVKNTGDNDGAYTYFFNCDEGSQFVSPSPPQNIGAGTTLSIEATLGLISEEGQSVANCDFVAREQRTGVEDSCSFNYCSEHQSQCVAGQKSCEIGGTQLWTCLGDGSYDKVGCQFGCEAFENTFRCILQSDEVCNNGIDDDGNGLIDSEDPGCKSGFFNSIKNFFSDLFGGVFGLLKTIKFFIVGISAILVTFASFDFLEAIKSLKRNKQMRGIVAVIIGLGVGWVLNMFIGSVVFWIMAVASLFALFYSKQIKTFLK